MEHTEKQQKAIEKAALPRCMGCRKTPEEISEYQKMATVYKTTATEYMKANEGTYNRFRKNKFYCTICYIKAGMPVVGE